MKGYHLVKNKNLIKNSGHKLSGHLWTAASEKYNRNQSNDAKYAGEY